MLSRVLEPEVMDRPEEARDYDAMDFAEVNGRFVADFLGAVGLAGAGVGAEVLDVGTGPGRIPILLGRADRRFHILGVDLAEAMLDLARRNVAEADLADRIRFARGDAKGLPFPDGRFRAVMSNTIVHHIPEPAQALGEMIRLVAPGGTLFVRDLARPADEGELDRLVDRHAGGEPPVARALFRDSLRAGLTPGEVRKIVGPLGVPPEALVMTSDRHWTLAWRKPGGGT